MPAHILQETDRAVIRFSYDAELIELLKVRVPSRFRTWDPSDKSWTISEPWVKTVTALLVGRFGASKVTLVDNRPGAKREPDPPPPAGGKAPTDGDRQTILDLQRALSRERSARLTAQRDVARLRAAGSSSSSSGDWAADLHRRLPEAMRDTVYKRLLAALHPDTNGGSAEAAELTKSLNATFRPPKSGR